MILLQCGVGTVMSSLVDIRLSNYSNFGIHVIFSVKDRRTVNNSIYFLQLESNYDCTVGAVAEQLAAV